MLHSSIQMPNLPLANSMCAQSGAPPATQFRRQPFLSSPKNLCGSHPQSCQNHLPLAAPPCPRHPNNPARLTSGMRQTSTTPLAMEASIAMNPLLRPISFTMPSPRRPLAAST